ncbi:MAG: pitrilysin family protein [Clostridia bacterium]|nr:pitrilysin family protein [Clostridia bacterium]
MYKISRLKNGIRVVTENIDYVKSVSAGVWIGAGSAMETLQNNGASHYIEHMLFKGTRMRSASQIAKEMDSVGGQLNAVTSKEYTCYYVKVMTEHLELAFDVLADMITNSTFTEENIETERKVICEEISMCDDTPEDFIHDNLSRIMWQGDALGFPIAGTEETLNGITRDTLLGYKDSFYCAENMVISVVGNFDEKKILEVLEEKFGGISEKVKTPYNQKKIEVKSGIDIAGKDIEQCHMCLGLEGYPKGDDRLYDLLVMNAVLGGNMSSRLFQKVREELGLAYSIYSYANTYRKNGSMVIYAGLNSGRLLDALKTIGVEIELLKKEKLSDEEINISKQQMKASVIMGLESISSRMSSYGKSILFEDEIKSVEETIKRIESVSRESVAEVIDSVFDKAKLNIAVCGRITASKEDVLDALSF